MKRDSRLVTDLAARLSTQTKSTLQQVSDTPRHNVIIVRLPPGEQVAASCRSLAVT